MTNELIVMEPVIGPVLFFLAVVLLVVFLRDTFRPSKSKEYRQSLADMYVVGKIKQIAKKDGLDLSAEFLDFSKVMKNKKIDYEALDSTIERELQEKITEDKKKAVTPEE